MLPRLADAAALQAYITGLGPGSNREAFGLQNFKTRIEGERGSDKP